MPALTITGGGTWLRNLVEGQRAAADYRGATQGHDVHPRGRGSAAVNELAEQDHEFRMCSAASYRRRPGQSRTAAHRRIHAQDLPRPLCVYPSDQAPFDS